MQQRTDIFSAAMHPPVEQFPAPWSPALHTRDYCQLDEPGFESSLLKADRRDTDGEVKTPRPRTPRIEQDNAVADLYEGAMRVPANDGAETGCSRIEIQIVHVMDEIEQALPDLNNFVPGKGVCPFSLIHIAPHRHHRCYFPQPVDYLRIANVSCMDNQTRPFQCFERLRPDQAVRIGYDSDCFSVHVYSLSSGGCRESAGRYCVTCVRLFRDGANTNVIPVMLM